ncbi:6-phosphogluconolactonase [Solidesulfovibrio sp.]|uniref:6-phosphogluconolactonase n=1 Tax=Solidesulfovibrio sp. TaxID=2910990 RepID=UPI00260CCAA1|nr:6-phosphogluconolactonase [Solidesulfovibrio sp.]
MTRDIRRFSDAAALTVAALQAVREAAHEAVARRGRFAVALSGGSSPLALYAAMAREGYGAPFEATLFFFGDERLVPVADRRNTFGTVAPILFTPTPVPVGNIRPMPVEVRPAALAAETYEAEIREVLGAGPHEIPRFDLILLGMGPDGHTASLFPGSPALTERERLVAAVPAPTLVEPRVPRLTFTLPLLNAARRVLFLTATKGREQALAKALADAPDPAVPASLVRPGQGELTWLVAEG